MTKNKVKILECLVSTCSIGCDHGYRIEVGPNNSNNASTSETPMKSNESKSNSKADLITEFENDAKKVVDYFVGSSKQVNPEILRIAERRRQPNL